MAQHWTDHRIPFAQNGNSSHNWLSGQLCNQDEGWHGSHMPKTFIKEIQGRRCHPRRAWMCLQMLLYFKEGVTVHWNCTKAGHQDLSHQPAFLLTHSCPRPDKGEMRRQGLEREEERHGSLLALELLVFFLAATFFKLTSSNPISPVWPRLFHLWRWPRERMHTLVRPPLPLPRAHSWSITGQPFPQTKH